MLDTVSSRLSLFRIDHRLFSCRMSRLAFPSVLLRAWDKTSSPRNQQSTVLKKKKIREGWSLTLLIAVLCAGRATFGLTDKSDLIRVWQSDFTACQWCGRARGSKTFACCFLQITDRIKTLFLLAGSGENQRTLTYFSNSWKGPR